MFLVFPLVFLAVFPNNLSFSVTCSIISRLVIVLASLLLRRFDLSLLCLEKVWNEKTCLGH